MKVGLCEKNVSSYGPMCESKSTNSDRNEVVPKIIVQISITVKTVLRAFFKKNYYYYFLPVKIQKNQEKFQHSDTQEKDSTLTSSEQEGRVLMDTWINSQRLS